MLPYNSFEFFVIMALFIATPAVLKLFLKNRSYKYVLAALNFGYLSILFPQPYHFFSLIIYSYFIVWLFSDVLKVKNKLYGVLALIIPLMLVKFGIKAGGMNEWLPFAGLSYASFRFVGYYMDKSPDEKITDFVTYFNFLSFIPTVFIGPIDRLGRFKASQDNGFTAIAGDNFVSGWNSFVKGLAFKFIFAELIDRYWLNLFPEGSNEFLHVANSMYAYYFYLFFDFAGYSWMALGIGKMMGMAVPVNFTNPFLAQNPPDFWKKWHISLGDWLKDYFFSLFTCF